MPQNHRSPASKLKSNQFFPCDILLYHKFEDLKSLNAIRQIPEIMHYPAIIYVGNVYCASFLIAAIKKPPFFLKQSGGRFLW
jgi:hypothetical protein